MTINDLYKLVQSGSADAEKQLFAALSVRFHLFSIQKISNKQDAEEVIQDALMTIYKEYKNLDIEHSFSAWAYRVLEIRILNYFHKQKVQKDIDKKLYDRFFQSSPDTPPDMEDLKKQLLHCLHLICDANSRYGRILNFNYQGYSTKEICSKLGISSNNFYTILSRSRSMLEYCLEKGSIQ